MRKCIFALMLLLASAAFAQTSEQVRSTSEIMADLRSQVTELEKISDERAKALEGDKATIDDLASRLSSVSLSIDKTMNDLSTANETIIKQNEKIRSQRSMLAVLASVLGLFFLAHIAVIILKTGFNIEAPYWLNTII